MLLEDNAGIPEQFASTLDLQSADHYQRLRLMHCLEISTNLSHLVEISSAKVLSLRSSAGESFSTASLSWRTQPTHLRSLLESDRVRSTFIR